MSDKEEAMDDSVRANDEEKKADDDDSENYEENDSDAEEEDEEDSQDEEEAGEEDENEGPQQTYLPGKPLEEGEELVCDENAYLMFHQANTGIYLTFSLL
jgi:ribosome assembly protein RRB1